MTKKDKPILLITCLGNKDPQWNPNLKQPIRHSLDKATNDRGELDGPILSAISSAHSQKITIGAIAIIYAPNSDPQSINQRASKLDLMIKNRYPEISPILLEATKKVTDVEPDSGQERDVQSPIPVYDYEANFNHFPQLISSLTKKYTAFQPAILVSGGTPQQNYALLEIARTFSDIHLYQLLNPTPNGVDAHLNRNNLRLIDTSSLNSSSLLGQKIQLLEDEIKQLREDIHHTRVLKNSPQFTELDLDAFSSSGLVWTQLSTQQQVHLLRQAALKKLTASKTAKILNISSKTVRQRIKEHEITLAAGQAGRPKSKL